MATYKNIYAEKIYTFLAPLLGDSMAKSALQIRCKKLSITEETISEKDLPILADAIKMGLVCFIGSEKANYISISIKSIK